ncbi:uncharacterized protein LOC111061330 isoform X1 [Nilaparvata lugens]|uniref:uncharacterized protein LOC111061330 isoform X1 n=1 Tax=Nilaparvata lugens TaxID=108931 RepID=UPI00193DD1E4|nr:uncharacterized protein LOC111061330 isoform X1 [Nilaparvata lugens]
MSQSASARFSADEDELLIEFVQKEDMLYDLKHKEFKNSTKKDLLRNEIGRRLEKEGSECKKRWKSMRDHYKREKKEEKGTTGKAAKKKRAQYWQRLQFLDTVEDERTSFTNVVTASDVGASSETPQQGIPEEYEEDASMEHRSQELSPHTSSQHTEQTNTTPSQHEKRSELEFHRRNPKQRKDSSVLQKYLQERKEDRNHLKRCLEGLMTYPGPPQNETEIDMFFKTMAATVKKFRPDLATQTKASVFKIVTDMEVLNQRLSIPGDSGFTDIQYDNNQLRPSPSSTFSPWSTPHSSHTQASDPYSDIVSQAFQTALVGTENNE